MKFLMYSECGEGAQILSRIQDEGNDCALFIKDKIYANVFDGILHKVTSPDSFIDDKTVILFDMSGNGDLADKYRRSGHLVFGASGLADQLEHDRAFGFSVMEKAGIKIPEHKEFKSFEEGRAYVRETNKRLVFKPSGSMPCKLTYCAKDAEELYVYLTFVEKQFGKQIDSFILQDFIEGAVVSSEFFCAGKGFVYPSNHTVEVKKSMNDELGPSTGCSGNVAWICGDDRIIVEGVGKLASFVEKEQYIGQIDLNAVVNEDGVYGLEWTPRFGYEATPTMLTMLDMDFGEFFHGLASGHLEDADFSDLYAGGIRVTIPPYPAEPKKGKDTEEISPNKGIPILNWEDYHEDLYFYEVCIGDDELEHSGGTGVIACAMGSGETPEESLKQPREILDAIVIPDKQYRTDLEQVLPKMIKETLQYA